MIYKPKPAFTEKEKELLYLVAQLILENMEQTAPQPNKPRDIVALTDDEAEKLIQLLQTLAETKKFQEACYLVQNLTRQTSDIDKRLRDIYLYNRSTSEKRRVAANYKWAEFLERLGIRHSHSFQRKATPMTLENFYEMEKTLFEELQLDKKIVDLFMTLVSAQNKNLTHIQEQGVTKLPPQGIISAIKKPISVLKGNKRTHGNTLSELDLASIAIIVSNYSVLFTTRDWGVAGTLSMLAGAHTSTFIPPK
ncbi:hypothetical protein [Micavibrio aeruginosavorus]|uniref:Uncharacterized protein n=1 Tax=Micavibrio aeruginosavorus EPB TaxID=349215 RepID=M4VFL7_9BACT|nr:hypothetical protein [Micavibrio aeruginosavorus]AGH97285.1 hypothetical protein A11S_458 [Micavibrio aeruginosavorus EPB]